MKILFISEGSHTQDYLRDCVFRGMRELFGPDVADVNKLDSMYVGADRSSMYGNGMTLYAELPDIEVDRTDILAKISARYFDLVVYGSVHRCHDHLRQVASMYPPNRVVYIDGEDHTSALTGLPGTYFKRELHNPLPGIHPIQFAIPKEKILKSPPVKSRLMAPMDPIDKTTYIYKTEKEYYAQYAESYYAATMRKGGADCLRHYEILSQWCLPYFRSFEAVPPTIMVNLPRQEMILIAKMWEYFSIQFGHESVDILEYLWERLAEPMVNCLRAYMTTERLATYVLDTCGVRESVTA